MTSKIIRKGLLNPSTCRYVSPYHTVLHRGGPKAGLLLYSIGVVDELRWRIEAIWVLHYKKLEEGFGEVYIPEALAEENSGAAPGVGR
jgi:hypothetical protein